MSEELDADFDMRYPGGAGVRAQLRRPTAGFSVTVLFGPSGSGKTTLLRCLAGLETPRRGMIRFGGETWLDAGKGISLSPQRRQVGYLSQDYALFPHLSVAENVGFGLGGMSRAERHRTVREVLSRFGIEEFAARFPRQLSGGQQQRAALARAIVRRPRLLLLDEPLSALDAPTREQVRRELRPRLAEAGIPAFLVTHDRVEAIALADHLVVMDGGAILQQGAVQEIFSRPASRAVAQVVGVETVEAGEVLRVEEGLAIVRVAGIELLAVAGDAGMGRVYVCIRAEDIVLQKSGSASSARNHLPGTVHSLDREGPMVRVCVDCGFRLGALVTRLSCEELGLRIGDAVTAVVKAPAIHLVSP